jgi:hypothetical protein
MERWCRKIEQPVKWETCYFRMSKGRSMIAEIVLVVDFYEKVD